MNIQNLSSYDPFADTGDSANPSGNDQDSKSKSQTQQEKYIHIRVQQRNGRKTLTTVQGLPKEYDPKKVLKELKKLFACNGTLVHEEEHGDIIQLQGDQRQKAAAFLVEEMQIAKAEVKVHGF